MYIITDKDDVIIKISTTIGYQSNGNVLVDEGKLAIAKPLVKKVYEVETVEEGIEEQKYCYTDKKGFYGNENYVEHYSLEDRVSAVEDVINMILLS